jgi:hypothetical protein
MLFPLIVVVGELKHNSLNFELKAFVIAIVEVWPSRVLERHVTHCVDPARALSDFFKCFLLERYHQSRGRNFNVDFVIFEVVLHAFRHRVDLTLQLVELIGCLQLGSLI